MWRNSSRDLIQITDELCTAADARTLHQRQRNVGANNNSPFSRDVELAVADKYGFHALMFPCHRVVGGWVKKGTTQRLDVSPTHWREWQSTEPQKPSAVFTR